MNHFDFKYHMLAHEVENISDHEFESNGLTGYDLELSCKYCGKELCRYDRVNEVTLTCRRNN